MALQGSLSDAGLFNISESIEGWVATINWKVLNQDPFTNSSLLQISCDLHSSIDIDVSVERIRVYLNRDILINENPNATYHIDADQTINLYTTTTTVLHESDGYQVFSLGGSWDVKWLGKYLSSGDVSFSTTTDILDRVKRTAYLTATLNGEKSCTDETSFTIEYENPLGEAAESLMAGISVSRGAVMEVPYRPISKTGTSYTFNITANEWKAIYASTLDKFVITTPITFYLHSVIPYTQNSSGTEQAVTSEEKTLNFVNYKPTLDVQLEDVDALSLSLTGNKNKLIRHVSDVRFSLSPAVYKQSTLKNLWITNGDTDIFAEAGTFENIKGNKFTAYIEDSRGYTATSEHEYTVANDDFVEYVPLTCTVKSSLMDANGNLLVTVSGKYFKGDFGVTENSLSLRYNITNTGEENWIDLGVVEPTVDIRNNYTYTFPINNLDYTDRYTLQVCATDKVNRVGSTTSTIVSAKPVFDWSKIDFAFYVPVTINGATVPSIVEQGYSGIWQYRKWDDGTGECWGKVSFNTPVSTALGSLFTSGVIAASNVTFPFTFTEVPVLTATLDSKAAACWLMASSNTQNAQKTSTTSTGRYEIARATELSNGAFTINYYIKGRWK